MFKKDSIITVYCIDRGLDKKNSTADCDRVYNKKIETYLEAAQALRAPHR